VDDQIILNQLLDLAERLGIEVRRVGLDGQSGGLCRLRDKQVLFVDTVATLSDQIACAAGGLASLADIDNCYVLPQVREVLEQYREKS